MMSKRIHGMSVVDFEVSVAIKFRNKVDNARERGLEFNLSFAEFRRIMASKRCAYTGVELTFKENGPAAKWKDSDLSIERIDNEKGYVSGNCVAVCHAANVLKSVFENPNAFLKVDHAVKMFANIDKMNKK